MAGILAGDVALVGRSLGSDAIIEPVRAPLIPGFQAVKEAAGAAGERRGGAAAGREGYCSREGGVLQQGGRSTVGCSSRAFGGGLARGCCRVTVGYCKTEGWVQQQER